MEDCFDSALEYGDYPFAGYGSHNLVGMQYYSGYPLQQVSSFHSIYFKRRYDNIDILSLDLINDK